MKIDILNTKYQIIKIPETDEHLRDENGDRLSGITDYSECKIYILDNLQDRYYRHTMRHEIIHALLYECGLEAEMYHPDYGHDEQMIDWIAIQYPRLKEIFQKLDIDY